MMIATSLLLLSSVLGADYFARTAGSRPLPGRAGGFRRLKSSNEEVRRIENDSDTWGFGGYGQPCRDTVPYCKFDLHCKIHPIQSYCTDQPQPKAQEGAKCGEFADPGQPKECATGLTCQSRWAADIGNHERCEPWFHGRVPPAMWDDFEDQRRLTGINGGIIPQVLYPELGEAVELEAPSTSLISRRLTPRCCSEDTAECNACKANMHPDAYCRREWFLVQNCDKFPPNTDRSSEFCLTRRNANALGCAGYYADRCCTDWDIECNACRAGFSPEQYCDVEFDHVAKSVPGCFEYLP